MSIIVHVKQSPKSGRWFVRAVDDDNGVVFTDAYETEEKARAEAAKSQKHFDDIAEGDDVFADE